MTVIALISDLHIGGSRAKDLNPVLTGGELTDEYLSDFARFAAALLRESSVEYLLVTGDVTNRATKAEVEHSSSVIGEIASALNVKESSVFWVPGNHDRCWSLIEAHGDVGRAYDFFTDDSTHFLTRREKSASGSLFTNPYVCVWEKDDLVVMGINTSVDDTSRSKIHHGSADQKIVDGIRELATEIDASIVRPWIFLLHHHPIDYNDSSGYWKDFSQLQFNARLRSVLSDIGFDLVIHGHRHHPNLSYELSNNGHGRAFICSGSFSAVLPQDDRLLNQFHLIAVDERQNRIEPLNGELRSWSYSIPRGWAKSRQKSGGIEHRLGFGKLLEFEVAKESVSAELAKLEKNRYAKWIDVAERNSDLKLLPNRLIRRVLNAIAQESSWVLHDVRDLDDLVLLIEDC